MRNVVWCKERTARLHAASGACARRDYVVGTQELCATGDSLSRAVGNVSKLAFSVDMYGASENGQRTAYVVI